MGISKDGSSSAVAVIAALLMPVRPARDKILPGTQVHWLIATAGGARETGRRRHEHV